MGMLRPLICDFNQSEACHVSTCSHSAVPPFHLWPSFNNLAICKIRIINNYKIKLKPFLLSKPIRPTCRSISLCRATTISQMSRWLPAALITTETGRENFLLMFLLAKAEAQQNSLHCQIGKAKPNLQNYKQLPAIWSCMRVSVAAINDVVIILMQYLFSHRCVSIMANRLFGC